MDTRPLSDADVSTVGDTGSGSLHGVRSFDFLTDLPITIANFFSGYRFNLFIYGDLHQPIPISVNNRMIELHKSGILHEWEFMPRDHNKYRWYDHLYLDALKRHHPEATHIVKIDQDCAMFREPNSDIVQKYVDWLDNGYNFVCQPASGPNDTSWHASTRFFVTKAGTIDFEETERCLNQEHVHQVYGKEWWAPCFEHCAALAAGGKVLYPPPDEDSYTVFSWVKYHQGTLKKLNAMPYEEIQKYITKCGNIHGARDLVGCLA